MPRSDAALDDPALQLYAKDVSCGTVKIALATGTMSPQGWHEALSRALAAAGLEVDLEIWKGHPVGARYAIVWLPPADLFAAETRLRAVFNLGAGVEALLARVPPELPIIRLVDAGMAAEIAEYACFAIARIHRGLDRFAPPPQGLRDWNAPHPRDERPLVGVLGLGAMGLAVLEAARRFGYPVAGWSRRRHEIAGVETFAGPHELDAFLSRTDILVDALPLTAQTANLLDAYAFAQMPRGSHVINVGRGGTIVDEDLVAALDEGRLASATLDVFRVEPLPADHPFWAHPRITVTPHVAAPTPYGPACEQIAAAMKQIEQGVDVSRLPGFVDRSAGY
jgi:glyoxylate/hydroxypyruvate reductase A